MQKPSLFASGPRYGLARLISLSLCLALTLAPAIPPVAAQTPAAPVPLSGDKLPPTFPLAQDTGRAALTQMLRQLQNTGRLMQVTAHPDDEDGGMLTLQARGRGTSVLLMTLTRGEGGQNKTGGNLFDALGILRTAELTASSKTYGAQQRFSRVADFGYSKTAAESLAKWQSTDGTPGGVALEDIVRVIRTFRPDVLTARFSGTEGDGHGHHQASALLTKEAFRAAADPKRFPEQIAQGLLPWQPRKFYNGVLPWLDKAEYTLSYKTTTKDVALSTTYAAFGLEGLRHQLSQGAGSWSLGDEDRYSKYILHDAAMPPTYSVAPGAHEGDFFDGMDVTLPGLASRLADEESNVPYLRPALEDMQRAIAKAAKEADSDPSKAVAPLLEAAETLHTILPMLATSGLSPLARADQLDRLTEKQGQLNDAILLASGVTFDAEVSQSQNAGSPPPPEAQAPTIAAPGQAVNLVIHFHNGSHWKVRVEEVTLDGPADTSGKPISGDSFIEKSYVSPDRLVEPGQDFYANFRIRIPANAAFTRQYWHREDPETSSLNTVDDKRFQSLPFPPPPFRAHATYAVVGLDHEPHKLNFATHPLTFGKGRQTASAEVTAPVVVPFTDHSGTRQTRPLAIGPAYSLLLDSPTQVLTAGSTKPIRVGVTVRSSQPLASQGQLALALPNGWASEPESALVSFSRSGDEKHVDFLVHPARTAEGRAQISANLLAKGALYDLGYSLVTRADLDSFYYYQPALQRVRVVNVKLPAHLAIGYVAGAGDNIPTALKQLGMDVTSLTPEDLATANLARFQTIVLGIRAYDVSKDLPTSNPKLLDWVQQGGTLIVQYNADTDNFNKAKVTPFPLTLSRVRVSVEEAPVEMLIPADSLFHSPNPIQPSDFDGWVQERGLYFASDWDKAFEPLLRSNDPGEKPQSGGLLRAKYGKGLYIYTGYAFFRQIPAGVPGAVRLYINLLTQGQ